MDATLKARNLRQSATEVEKTLWYHLRNRNLCQFKFKRQFTIGPYIVDFICLKRKLIVELDGSQHFDAAEYDARRTADLMARGYKVIRFWNNEVTEDLNAVLEKIMYECEGVASI